MVHKNCEWVKTTNDLDNSVSQRPNVFRSAKLLNNFTVEVGQDNRNCRNVQNAVSTGSASQPHIPMLRLGDVPERGQRMAASWCNDDRCPPIVSCC